MFGLCSPSVAAWPKAGGATRADRARKAPTNRRMTAVTPPCAETCGSGLGAFRRARVHERLHGRLDLRPQLLEPRRDRQLLAERLERLVDREAGARGGQLEQHAARLAEVDRLEVVPVDHLSGVGAVLAHLVAPGLMVLVGRVPRDVVDAARALDAAPTGRGVIEDQAAALVPAGLPAAGVGRLEAEPLLQQLAAALHARGESAHRVEALERVLGGDL